MRGWRCVEGAEAKCRMSSRHWSRTYGQAGTYTVVVKVIDILGNDTTKTLEMAVK
jgi:hypothetical protein